MSVSRHTAVDGPARVMSSKLLEEMHSGSASQRAALTIDGWSVFVLAADSTIEHDREVAATRGTEGFPDTSKDCRAIPRRTDLLETDGSSWSFPLISPRVVRSPLVSRHSGKRQWYCENENIIRTARAMEIDSQSLAFVGRHRRHFESSTHGDFIRIA